MSYIKNKDGVFYCNYRYRGEYVKCKAKTEFELIKKIEKRIKTIDTLKKFPELKEEKIKKKYTFSKVFNMYCKYKRYNPETQRKKNVIFNKYITSYFNDNSLMNLTKKDLINWYNNLLDILDTGQFQENRFNRIVDVMQEIIKYARQEGIEISPTVKPSLIEKIKEKKIVSKKTEENYVMPEEFDIFIREIKKIPECLFKVIEKDYFIIMSEFLYYTGARINEARGVKRFDFKNGDRLTKIPFVEIKRQLKDYKNEIMPSLKNGNPERRVYLMRDIYERFINFFDSKGIKEDEFVFMDKRCDLVITRKKYADMLSRFIKLLKKDNRLPNSFPNILTPHGLRYSNTIYLKRLGVSIELAAKMQGHTVSVMLDIYTRMDKTEIDTIFGEVKIT